MTTNWLRCTREHPCQKCGKTDPCTIAPDIGLCWCLRVESDRPSKNILGGYIHKLSDEPRTYTPPPKPEPETTVDCEALLCRWAISTSPDHVREFATSLGVSAVALTMLGVVWCNESRAWAFPMRDGADKLTGIQLRYQDGTKRVLKGTHAGLFIPRGELRDIGNTIYICEGASDCAALLSMSLPAVGRFAATATADYLLDFVRRRRFSRVVIVSDLDAVGERGAIQLQAALPVPSVIMFPPCKDVREAVKLGMTGEMLTGMVRDMVWTQPNRKKAKSVQSAAHVVRNF